MPNFNLEFFLKPFNLIFRLYYILCNYQAESLVVFCIFYVYGAYKNFKYINLIS